VNVALRRLSFAVYPRRRLVSAATLVSALPSSFDVVFCARSQARLGVASASGPGHRALRLVRMLINRQLGASVFSSAYAAYSLLGGEDGYVSAPVAVLPPAQFVAAVRQDPTVPTADVTYVAGGGGDNRRNWGSAFDDYRYRPACLRDLSPYEFTMYFNTKARFRFNDEPADDEFDDLTANQWAFAEGHPHRADRFVLKRRVPVVPNLFMDPPPRPGPDEEIGDRHAAYAAYMLGLLLADHDWSARVAASGGCAWRALVAWETEAEARASGALLSECYDRSLVCVGARAQVSNSADIVVPPILSPAACS
jgi:hypothetical protein